MKVLLLAAGKPLFALLTGAVFVSVPVSHEKMIEVERAQVEHMHELEALERAAEEGARENAEPEEAAPEEAPVR